MRLLNSIYNCDIQFHWGCTQNDKRIHFFRRTCLQEFTIDLKGYQSLHCEIINFWPWGDCLRFERECIVVVGIYCLIHREVTNISS